MEIMWYGDIKKAKTASIRQSPVSMEPFVNMDIIYKNILTKRLIASVKKEVCSVKGYETALKLKPRILLMDKANPIRPYMTEKTILIFL